MQGREAEAEDVGTASCPVRFLKGKAKASPHYLPLLIIIST